MLSLPMLIQVYGSDAAYEAAIMQEDGSEANETIDELSNLQAVSSAGPSESNPLSMSPLYSLLPLALAAPTTKECIFPARSTL